MGSRRATGSANLTQYVTGPKAIAHFYCELAEMQERRRETMAVIHNYRTPGIEQIGLGQSHYARRGCYNRSTRWSRNVYSVMGCAGGTVINTLTAIHAADATGYGPAESLSHCH